MGRDPSIPNCQFPSARGCRMARQRASKDRPRPRGANVLSQEPNPLRQAVSKEPQRGDPPPRGATHADKSPRLRAPPRPRPLSSLLSRLPPRLGFAWRSHAHPEPSQGHPPGFWPTAAALTRYRPHIASREARRSLSIPGAWPQRSERVGDRYRAGPHDSRCGPRESRIWRPARVYAHVKSSDVNIIPSIAIRTIHGEQKTGIE